MNLGFGETVKNTALNNLQGKVNLQQFKIVTISCFYKLAYFYLNPRFVFCKSCLYQRIR